MTTTWSMSVEIHIFRMNRVESEHVPTSISGWRAPSHGIDERVHETRERSVHGVLTRYLIVDLFTMRLPGASPAPDCILGAAPTAGLVSGSRMCTTGRVNQRK